MIEMYEKALDLQPLNGNESQKISSGQKLSNNTKRFDYIDCFMLKAKPKSYHGCNY